MKPTLLLAAVLAAAPALLARSADAGEDVRDFDGSLAEALAFGNQAEVAVSDYAAANVTTPQVKDFAQKMSQTHGEMLRKLEAFAPEVTDIRTLDVSAAGDRDGRPSMERVWTEAAARCLDMTLKDMKQYEGMDLDWAYVNQQKAAHIKMLSELKAMQGIGSEKFNAIVDEAVGHTEGHARKLDTLITTLERLERS